MMWFGKPMASVTIIEIAGFIGSGGCFLAACGCTPTARVAVPGVPPGDADRLILIIAVDGREIALKDGRKFLLAGISVDGLNREERRAFENNVLERSSGTYLLAVPLPDGKSALLEDTMLVRNLPSRILKTHRQDFNSGVISNGFARADPGSLTTEELRRLYVEAEDSARKEKRGIWGD